VSFVAASRESDSVINTGLLPFHPDVAHRERSDDYIPLGGFVLNERK
jgi:hypothetical protein